MTMSADEGSSEVVRWSNRGSFRTVCNQYESDRPSCFGKPKRSPDNLGAEASSLTFSIADTPCSIMPVNAAPAGGTSTLGDLPIVVMLNVCTGMHK